MGTELKRYAHNFTPKPGAILGKCVVCDRYMGDHDNVNNAVQQECDYVRCGGKGYFFIKLFNRRTNKNQLTRVKCPRCKGTGKVDVPT